MTKLKRFVSALLVSCMMFSVLMMNAGAIDTTTFADNEAVDVLTPFNPNIELYSVNRPTEYWDLSTKSYTGSYAGLGGLYTNYYFRPNKNGELHFYITATSEGSTEYLEVRCIKRGLATTVDSRKTGEIDTEKQYFEYTFSNLNPNTDYYFQLISGGHYRLSGYLAVWH